MISPARRLRDALEPVAALSFWSDCSKDAYAALGLTDFAPAYVWSRSSVLGVADAAVVIAAFGVFEPGLVVSGLERGRVRCSLEQIRDATQTGAGDAVRTVLGDEEVEHVVAALRRGVEAADVMGRPLFAGHKSWTWPEDPHNGLWRAATAWRELRGDSHLAACVTAGVSGLQANVLTELAVGYPLGEYSATRGWSGADIAAAADGLRDRGLLDEDVLSAEGTAVREQLERATDAALAPAIAAVGDDLEHVVDRANAWAQTIVERGWFPNDPRKRSAG